MNKIAIIKKAVSFAVGAGVSKIVHDIIENNVEIEKPYQKVTVPLASVAIGGVVADATSTYTDAFIDEVVDLYDVVKSVFTKK